MNDQAVAIEDHYTGHVTADGAAAQLTVPGAAITKLSVGPMDNNVYLIVCSATSKALLVDAANDADRILSLLDQLAPRPELIVTTHQHADHWLALAAIAEATGSATAAHSLDAPTLPVAPTTLIADDDVLSIGELDITVIHLAGHTPGGVALAFTAGGRTHLFTGDSLFPGGIGKTADAEAFTSLLNDVETKLFARYPDDTVIYPGHGDDTTLGAERPQLGQWRARGW